MHTVRTNAVNFSAASSLLPEGSIFHRGTALQYTAMVDLMEQAKLDCNIFQPFDERPVGPGLQQMANDGKFPYLSDGLAYYQIVQAHVDAWFVKAGTDAVTDAQAQEFYAAIQKTTQDMRYTLPAEFSRDALASLCTQFIWTVTAYHQLVGVVNGYTQFASGLGLRVVPGATQTDLECYVIGAVITALTGIWTPKLLCKFANYFGQGDSVPAWEVDVWKDFVQACEAQSQVVAAANQTRVFDFKAFDPAEMECAVSV